MFLTESICQEHRFFQGKDTTVIFKFLHEDKVLMTDFLAHNYQEKCRPLHFLETYQVLPERWLEPNATQNTSRRIRGEAGEGTSTGSTGTVAGLAVVAIEELSIVTGDRTPGSLKAARDTDEL